MRRSYVVGPRSRSGFSRWSHRWRTLSTTPVQVQRDWLLQMMEDDEDDVVGTSVSGHGGLEEATKEAPTRRLERMSLSTVMGRALLLDSAPAYAPAPAPTSVPTSVPASSFTSVLTPSGLGAHSVPPSARYEARVSRAKLARKIRPSSMQTSGRGGASTPGPLPAMSDADPPARVSMPNPSRTAQIWL